MKQQKTPAFREAEKAKTPFGPVPGATFADVVGRSASVPGRSISSMQQESVRFMNQRLEDNMKAASEIGNCKSLPDLMALQQNWFATMTRAYAEEWHRYTTLLSDIMRGDREVPDADSSAGATRARED
ncbi:MAG: phasin family protein [Alphaproteobacteria bacterium]